MELLFALSSSAAILFLGMNTGDCADIIGGVESIPHSRPYMAFIHTPINNRRTYCGGTLIHNNWVLTAAHCEINWKTTVVLGAHSLANPKERRQIFQIAAFFRHPYYSESPLLNDIMLLQLDGTSRINQYVQTIHLPQTFEDTRVGTECLVAGWGKTEKESIPATLHEVTVFIQNRHFCKNKYNSKYPVTSSNLCAGGFQDTWQGTCEGDSGGPLICGGIQRGITSFGGAKDYCAHPDLPSVFTRLTEDYLQWINNTIWG